jgi:hypothetical protein
MALEKRHPFRGFSNVLGYYPNVRQQWFAFKKARYEAWVRRLDCQSTPFFKSL